MCLSQIHWWSAVPTTECDSSSSPTPPNKSLRLWINIGPSAHPVDLNVIKVRLTQSCCNEDSQPAVPHCGLARSAEPMSVYTDSQSLLPCGWVKTLKVRSFGYKVIGSIWPLMSLYFWRCVVSSLVEFLLYFYFYWKKVNFNMTSVTFSGCTTRYIESFSNWRWIYWWDDNSLKLDSWLESVTDTCVIIHN